VRCILKENYINCKLLQLSSTTYFPDYPYYNIFGEIAHIDHYKEIAERDIDTMHIYTKPRIDHIFMNIEEKFLQIIFVEKMKCAIANEKERGRFLTCPAYPYSKDDERLKGD
jgi:hypothetical protein